VRCVNPAAFSASYCAIVIANFQEPDFWRTWVLIHKPSRYAIEFIAFSRKNGVYIARRQERYTTTRYDVDMDERDFYTERPESKAAEYTCPRCKRSNQYQVRWMRRTKKDRLPPRADERDRALYAKLRDYLVRVDDDVTCKTCQKRFEIPSHQTMVFLDKSSSSSPQGNDDDDDNRGNRA
jgi:hypothetical protein